MDFDLNPYLVHGNQTVTITLYITPNNANSTKPREVNNIEKTYNYNLNDTICNHILPKFRVGRK